VVREEKDRYAGSGRTPDQMDFRKICEDTGYCLAAGHEEAFGFFLNYENAQAFLTALDEGLANASKPNEIEADILIRPGQVTKELIDKNRYVNRIIGKNFPALRYVIESDEYTVRELSKGKHFCLEDCSGIKFIKWNQGYLNQEFEDHAFFGDKMRFYGTLSMSYFGREPSINLILDGWEMVE
jgi:single-stranded DNA-specific DHH superfamily exonuclease